MAINVKVSLSVDEFADGIRRMSDAEKEALLLALSKEDKLIARRLKEIKSNKVKTLSRGELRKYSMSRGLIWLMKLKLMPL